MTISDETFQVCLSCGHHVPYSWNAMSRVSGAAVRQTADGLSKPVPTSPLSSLVTKG